jgi:hypothetical protein
VSLHGKDYSLSRDGDQFFIVEKYLQEAPTRRRVDYTLGSRRVQHYLTRLPDGRIVVLPPSYDVEKKEWFHNLDIVDLEESSAVKVQVWNTNCFGCHVSGEAKGFDAATKTFATTWTDFGTSCERCHGPGREHATKYRDGSPAAVAGTTAGTATLIVHPRRLDGERSVTLCAQCHTLRDITRPGFAGGDDYYDYFTPLLEYAQKRNHDPAYWPNGRPRRFSNEAIAFWMSQCSFKGGATCLSCHQDVHEPNVERDQAIALKQDMLCASCHKSIVGDAEAHSRHRATANGARVGCVDCHMPRTTISLRHRMPDHTISVPAPEGTRRFGIPNACNECHRDQTPAWAESKVTSWFKTTRRTQSTDDAAAFSMAAKKDPKAVPLLTAIAGDPSHPPLLRANALGHLRGYSSPDALLALINAAADPHPALRTAAMLSLTEAGKSPGVRDAMERGLNDARRTVRMAAAIGMLNAGQGQEPRQALPPGVATAMDDHAARARFLNDDATTQLDLGKMYFLAGEWKKAESAIRQSLALEPKIAGGGYFLGLSMLGQGRVKEGIALLRRVDAADAHRKDADAVLAKLPSS